MDVLEKLGIEPLNSGSCAGYDGWSKSVDTPVLASINPADESIIASVQEPSKADYEHLIKSANVSFEQWQDVPAPKRGEVIRAIADALREHKDVLGSLVSLETGKIKQEGDGEVQEMIDIADYAAGLSRMIYGKIIPSERPKHHMQEQWHPLGSIGVITAFNFPVAVWAWNAMIAAVCGNTVVWKPSPKVPLCAIAVQHICNRVFKKFGYAGVFNLLITSDNQLAEKMVSDSRLSLISFTGSTAIGKIISQKVAARLGKSILELSGNNAVIIDETADLNKAVPSIVFGAVGTAGQRCTTTRRVIVHESRYEELLERLLDAYQQIKLGDPLDPNVLVGPLIDEAAVKCFQNAIKDLKAIDAKILCGGNIAERKGYFVEPTLVETKKNCDFLQKEIFAPILYLVRYSVWDEALNFHNSVPQGLSSSLFTESLVNAERFLSARGSDCGIANINIGTSGAEIGGAFGGEKETGGGREAGSDAWRAYMRRQTNTVNWGEGLPLAQGITFDLTSKKK